MLGGGGVFILSMADVKSKRKFAIKVKKNLGLKSYFFGSPKFRQL